MLQVGNPVDHYSRDAELFDYFAPQSGPLKDSTTRIQQSVLDACRLPANGFVLDVGSGNGWLADHLAKTRLRLVSVDLGMRNLVRMRRSDGAFQVVADAARLPFRDGAFVRVVACEIMEHLNEPQRLVNDAARVLGPGGWFIASTPYKEVLRTYLCIHCNRPTPANAHLHRFDERKHLDMLEAAGLRDARYRLRLNKVLMRSRLSYACRFLPFLLWKFIDSGLSALVRKAEIIVVSGRKQGDQ